MAFQRYAVPNGLTGNTSCRGMDPATVGVMMEKGAAATGLRIAGLAPAFII